MKVSIRNENINYDNIKNLGTKKHLIIRSDDSR